jgi:hypothetical protein
MRDYAYNFMGGLPENNQCTAISSWYEREGGWAHYFSLYTTHDHEERAYSPTSGTKIIVKTIPVDEVLDCIPEDLSTGSVTGELAASLGDEDPMSFEFNSDARMQFRTSQEMRAWGQSWPALCFEHWIGEDSDRDISAEDEEELLDVLERELGISLREHDEYVGNLMVSVENRSCRTAFNESPEELLDAWSAEDEDLTDEELLKLLDSWEVALDDIDEGQVDITLRREEFGSLLYEIEIPLSEEALLSREEAIDVAKGSIIDRTLKLVVGGEAKRYRLDQLDTPGASEEILKVSQNGRLLDEYLMPLIRQVNTSININPDSSSSGGRVLPPTLHSEPTVTAGRRNWDAIIASGVDGDFETWIVDDERDYDEIMGLIYDQLKGPVKISEPYLRPNRLEELVQEGEPDLDLWVVLGHKTRYMNNMRADFEDCVSTADDAGKGLHILWLPGEQSTPLHDRFILNEETGLIIGTSFNSLDSNVTVVSEIPEEQSQELERNFDYWWNNRTFRRQHSVELIDST